MFYFNSINQNYIKYAFKTELVICWKKKTDSKQFIKTIPKTVNYNICMDVKVTYNNGFICSEHRQTESWSTCTKTLNADQQGPVNVIR